jgi:signal peptidase I
MPHPTRLRSRATRLLSSVLPPAAALVATVVTLRFFVPPRLQAGASGFWPWLARAGDRQPLVLGVVLFVLFATVAGYWRRQLVTSDAERSADVSFGRATVTIAVLGALIFATRARLVEIAPVTGPSMEPTLNPGDRLVVNKLAYGLRLPFSHRALGAQLPQRGDLIVFPNPDRGHGPDEPASIVKRVIGLPGDEVAILDGSPVINGWIVPSCEVGPFLNGDATRLLRGRLVVEVLADRAYLTLRNPLDEDRFAPFTVPRGEVFVLGDDRPVSRDSRAWNGGRGGGFPIDAIEGRVSRLAAAVGSAGRLDLGHPFRGLRPELRALNVDVTRLDKRVAACTAHKPHSSWPPVPPPTATARPIAHMP